jgi:serine/threonine-protein kinase
MIENPIQIQLPDIRLINKIGEGGMSSIWKAMDLNRNEIVAVKILNREFTTNEQDLEQFKAEQKTMSEIDHEGIVKSYELRKTDSFWYYVMEYVDGYNFGSLLQRKQHLIEVDCLLICQSVALALDYAWNNHGVVHCDIKPDNIMINSDGVIKLTDLGLCYTYKFLKDGRQNVPDYVMGTPAYISPEQVYGDVELDCRSDIYSLGATLYHLATGRTLFPRLDSDDQLRAHCSENCWGTDPRVYKPQLSDGFCRLLDAMLVKDRDWRINSWDVVIQICRDIQAGVVFKERKTPGVSSIRLDAATA